MWPITFSGDMKRSKWFQDSVVRLQQVQACIPATPPADIMHPILSLTHLAIIYSMPLHIQMLFTAILNNNCLVTHKL